MSVPPRLASRLNETLGPDASGDLVTWLDELRREHAEQREASRDDFAELRQEMRAMESRIVEKLGGQMHAMEIALRNEIHAVDLKVERRSGDLIRWSFVFWVSAVAAIATLAGVLRN